MILLAKSTVSNAGIPGPLPSVDGVSVAALLVLSRREEASPIHKGMSAFALGMSAAAWAFPQWALPCSPVFPGALYLVLLAVAVVPPLLGKPPFTAWFARRKAPEAVWTTEPFLRINRHPDRPVAVLFSIGAASAAASGILGFHGSVREAASR